MAPHIKKISYGVLSIIGLTLSIFLAEGQNTVGDCQNENQQSVTGLEEVVSEFKSYFREANELTRSLRLDNQNLKDEIQVLKNRIEDHKNSVNSANEELKSQLLVHNRDTISQFEILHQKLERSHCPSGFNYTASNFPKCYAVLTQSADWNTAQQKCRQLHKNAHLAVINSAIEQQIISQIILNYDCVRTFYYENGDTLMFEFYWIGGQVKNISDCHSEFVWKPDDRTTLPIGYSNWYPAEPNCHRTIENTVSLFKNGQWNDMSSTWSTCSICEVLARI